MRGAIVILCDAKQCVVRVMARSKTTKREDVVNIRLTESQKSEAEIISKQLGFKSVSEYFRHLHEMAIKEVNQSQTNKLSVINYEDEARLYHKTKYGKIYHGDSLYLMHKIMQKESVDLIVTSPPFGLTRPKAYGNKTEEEYLRWFRGFAEGFKKILKPTGSLVIDIGGAWTRGEPTRSLYHFDLLMMLCKEYGFHLSQEHYWWNPSKLPTPVEWVNVQRCRVKDAINCVWWLSPTTRPKADNTKVLSPYSDSMKKLLKNGYNKSLRPSGHDISDKWAKDNGGAVPPNLLALANTESNSSYSQYCRDNKLTIHPARFPTGLPEYFIKFLTEPGDVVFDPFGGSCVTGEVAERHGRKWLACEMIEDYLHGALGRFVDGAEAPQKKRIRPYEIHPPCALEIA